MNKSQPHSNDKSSKKRSGAAHTAKVQFLTIDADMAGQRVDNFLLARLKGVPKSLIYRILRKGEVRVNKGRVKPEYKLKPDDVVRVPPVRVATKTELAKPSPSLAKLLNTSILYEDDGLIVVNKPSGLAVHGGSGVQLGLIESLREIRQQDTFLELVHRLDKDTSGCVMVAKNRRCLRYMQQLLREGRGIQKIYNALVSGRWPKRRRQVKVALHKSLQVSGERIVRAVEDGSEGAKSSLTEYRVLKHFKNCTLVEAKPITGRTHQIRVHCQYAGHSILGDEKYGDKSDEKLARDIGLRRLFLHAAQLEFMTIDKRQVSVAAPLSDDLVRVVENLIEE